MIQKSACFKYLGITLFFNLFLVSSETLALDALEIGLASQSPVKTAAVQEAFKELFPEREIHIHTYPAESGVATQPVETHVGLIGAENRLKRAKEEGKNTAIDYWVSIENYIKKTVPKGYWRDRAVVVVENSKMASKVIEFSNSVYFEDRYADVAKRGTDLNYLGTFQGYSTTIGEIIQKEYQEVGTQVDPQDWHSHMDFGGISRRDILKEAVIKGVLKTYIHRYMNFPKAGNQYRDLGPILGNFELRRATVQQLAKKYRNEKIDAVVGLEAGGLSWGMALAEELKVGFVPLRLKGKLPNPVLNKDDLQNVGREFEITDGSLPKGSRVLIIDDFIASGNHLIAAEGLLQEVGAHVVGTTCLIELTSFMGKRKLQSPFFSLLQYSK